MVGETPIFENFQNTFGGDVFFLPERMELAHLMLEKTQGELAAQKRILRVINRLLEEQLSQTEASSELVEVAHWADGSFVLGIGVVCRQIKNCTSSNEYCQFFTGLDIPVDELKARKAHQIVHTRSASLTKKDFVAVFDHIFDVCDTEAKYGIDEQVERRSALRNTLLILDHARDFIFKHNIERPGGLPMIVVHHLPDILFNSFLVFDNTKLGLIGEKMQKILERQGHTFSRQAIYDGFMESYDNYMKLIKTEAGIAA